MSFKENIINQYYELIMQLSSDERTELITRLKKKRAVKKISKQKTIHDFYGAFKSTKSADELIDDIHQSRTFNRKRVKL